MSAVTGLSIGKLVVDALGLPEMTQEVHISIVPNDVVVITIKTLASEENIKELVSILKKYELHEKKK